MAKIKKRKLRWKASDSSQVIGYKLYWSEDGVLNYDSNSKMLGNVTEIILPDEVASFKPGTGPILFGVTAVDEPGNESDMVTLSAPYQFSVPKAPEDLQMRAINDFSTPTTVQQSRSTGKDVNHDSPSEPHIVIRQINSGQNNGESTISAKLRMLEKQALAF